MDGSLVPAGYAQLHPFSRNWFENIAAVQFDHRLLALTTAAQSAAVGGGPARRSCRAGSRRAARAARRRRVQVALGISTLLLVVPIPLAAAHQAGPCCC